MSVTTTWGASSRRSAHRPPADVDVLIGPDGMGTILSVLVETQGYQGPYENPSPLHFQGPMGKLDLLSTGEYGSLDGVVDLGGLPVATLESLKSSKEKSKTTADEEMKDLLKFETEESEVYKEWKAEFEKAASDLLHIEQLLKHLH